MGMILSSPPLLAQRSCRVSIILIRTFRQQCNLSLQFTVSKFHPLSCFLFHVEHLFQLAHVMLPDKISINKNNPLASNTVLKNPQNPSALKQSVFF